MLILSALAVFLGSALTFAVQPMVAKRLLPLLGGAPGVWNACMVFFQALLLLGYLWAHRLVRRGGVAPGLGWHGGLVLLACVALPLGLPEGRVPGADDAPVAWLLTSLALMVGLPGLALAATAPLVQSWFASSSHPRARDPYFLYAASNLGSAAALVGYPLLIEPRLTHDAQETGWSVLFVVFLATLLGLGAAVRRSPGQALPQAQDAPTPPARDRCAWALLAALPSALVLAATQHVTTDIASIPLLWIAPLLLYLATFTVAFSRHGERATRVASALLPPSVLLAVLLTVFAERGSVLLQLGAHLAALGSVAMVAHGRLAARRPPAASLTSFYFWLALGGVVGGSFVALLAPVLFDQLLEYPLLLALSCLTLPRAFDRVTPRRVLADLGVPVLAAGALFVAITWVDELPLEPYVLGVGAARWLSLGLVAAVVLVGARRGRALALAIAALWFMPSPGGQMGELLLRERSFYGVSEVWTAETEAGRFHLLVHGTTTHGVQGLDELADTPTSYYGVDGPVGDVMRQIGGVDSARAAAGSARDPALGPALDPVGLVSDAHIDVAVVGLGAGAIAAHGKPGWRMTFFEMDPTVAAIAQDPAYFTCLERSAAETAIVLGDGRLTLGASGQRFDLIVLDAFSSDSVPVHLLTREAIALWFEHLKPGGVVLFNVSNDFLALGQILASAARDLGLVCLGRHRLEFSDEQLEALHYASSWVLLARSADDLELSHFSDGWGWLSPEDHVRTWTDDFSSLLSVMR